MSVKETENTEFRLDKGMPVFSDVDKTLLKGDSGQEWLVEAGLISREEFGEFIDSFHYDGLGHSNQLVEFLNRNEQIVDYLHEYLENIDMEEREGIGTVLDHRYDHGVPNIGSSAGYEPVIQTVTNGNLHDVVAGRLENGEPIFNGQNEKRDRVEQYLEQMGWDQSYTAIGDSNGDIGKIRGAAESGGYGIAIGGSLEEAKQRVDEATFYVGDPNSDHYTAAALLNDLTLEEPHRLSPEEMVGIYGFDFTGDVEAGELATEEDQRQLESFMDRIGDYHG